MHRQMLLMGRSKVQYHKAFRLPILNCIERFAHRSLAFTDQRMSSAMQIQELEMDKSEECTQEVALKFGDAATW